VAALLLSPATRVAHADPLDARHIVRLTNESRGGAGPPPWAFMQAAGYRFQMAAENLAKGYDTEPELQRAWMKSRGHRANILNPLFTEIGVADANGVVVVLFGRPAPPNR